MPKEGECRGETSAAKHGIKELWFPLCIQRDSAQSAPAGAARPRFSVLGRAQRKTDGAQRKTDGAQRKTAGGKSNAQLKAARSANLGRREAKVLLGIFRWPQAPRNLRMLTKPKLTTIRRTRILVVARRHIRALHRHTADHRLVAATAIFETRIARARVAVVAGDSLGNTLVIHTKVGRAGLAVVALAFVFALQAAVRHQQISAFSSGWITIVQCARIAIVARAGFASDAAIGDRAVVAFAITARCH